MGKNLLTLVPIEVQEKTKQQLVRSKGARWDKEERVWYIPSGTAWQPLRAMLRPAVAELADFASLADVVDNGLAREEKLFSVEADVFSIIDIGGSFVCTLTEACNLRQKIQVKLPKAITGGRSRAQLVDKRLSIVGHLRFYAPALTFQIDAVWLRVVGDSTLVTTRAAWETECAVLLANATPGDIVMAGTEQIALITTAGSKAYADFHKTIYNSIETSVEDRLVPDMSVETLIKAVAAVNAAHSADYIAIVRGGGEREALLQFSDPRLVRAIADSRIPVVTGIGHAEDTPLCGRVALAAADTPSLAAGLFNKAYNTARKEQREQLTAREQSARASEHRAEREQNAELRQKLTQQTAALAALKTDRDELVQEVYALERQKKNLNAELKKYRTNSIWRLIFDHCDRAIRRKIERRA